MRAALAAACLTLAGACAHTGAVEPSQPVVLVSGLDDHFLPETEEIPLHSRPGGPVTGAVPAGSLARASEIRGQWVKVTALESHTHSGVGAASHTHDVPEGWVGDYYLRSRVHAISPADPLCPVEAFREPGGRPTGPLPASAQVEFVTVHQDGTALWVRVRTVEEPAREAWVRRTALSEYSSLQLTEGLGHTHEGAEGPPPVASTGRCTAPEVP